MKPEEFDSLLNNRLFLIEKTLGSKADEYASNVDRLHNFKRMAEFERITPEKALLGAWAKHVVSIVDLILDVENKPLNLKLCNEKIVDGINYLILLEALIIERNQNETS